MPSLKRLIVSLYFDRASHDWVARDREGNLWILRRGDQVWEEREPYCESEGSELESVPTHYLFMLEANS